MDFLAYTKSELTNPVTLSFILLLAGPMVFSLFDFITLTRTRRKEKHFKKPLDKEHDDFTILIPIWGKMSYLKNLDFLKQYKNHVVLCTTSKESDEFNADLKQISDEHDFQIFRSDVAVAYQTVKPNPWHIFHNTLKGEGKKMLSDAARDEIIRDSFEVVKTKYCVFLDGDTVVKDDIRTIIGAMEDKDYDLASVRVLASKKDTLMEKLQAIEYELAMDARRVYPWLTSGAGTIAKTQAIKEIMSHHSLFFSGGDIEMGKIAMMLGFKVGHLPFEFLTDVPSTFKAWFKQRMAWCGGGFRHAVVNLHNYTWRHPFFFIYTTLIVYLLTPLRWLEAIRRPAIIPFVIAWYLVLIIIFHWRTFQWYYLLFPFYSLIQVMIVVPMGILTYFKMMHMSDNIGFIKLRNRSEERPLVEDIGL